MSASIDEVAAAVEEELAQAADLERVKRVRDKWLSRESALSPAR